MLAMADLLSSIGAASDVARLFLLKIGALDRPF